MSDLAKREFYLKNNQEGNNQEDLYVICNK